MFLPEELLFLLFEFLPVSEVAEMGTRAVSTFFANPKVWVTHLFKLMDVDSVLETNDETHPAFEYFRYARADLHKDEGIEPVRLKEQGSERFQGYRLWHNGLVKWHGHDTEKSLHFVRVVMQRFAHEEKVLGGPWCVELLFQGLREVRLEIAKGLLPVLFANCFSSRKCKTAMKCLEACQCAFPFLSKSFAVGLVDIWTNWILHDGDTWIQLRNSCIKALKHILDVILPTDEAVLATRYINAMAYAERGRRKGDFVVFRQQLRKLLVSEERR
eukprot:Skav214367  [mRNA]  locus=scaffold86:682896:683711:+ [translate_table: standard]